MAPHRPWLAAARPRGNLLKGVSRPGALVCRGWRAGQADDLALLGVSSQRASRSPGAPATATPHALSSASGRRILPSAGRRGPQRRRDRSRRGGRRSYRSMPSTATVPSGYCFVPRRTRLPPSRAGIRRRQLEPFRSAVTMRIPVGRPGRHSRTVGIPVTGRPAPQRATDIRRCPPWVMPSEERQSEITMHFHHRNANPRSRCIFITVGWENPVPSGSTTKTTGPAPCGVHRTATP
jgi:hypothetical protein